MSGLLRRLTRRGPATADENRSPAIESSDPAATPAETPAEPGGPQPVPASDEQATQLLPATTEHTAAQPVVEPQPDAPAADSPADQPAAFAAQPAPARDLPAGVDPAELSGAPAASARRGKLRRRLRYLRHVRLLLLRDLGGFTYEIHRSAGGTPQESHRKLAAAKAERISAIDVEVSTLEARLGEPHAGTVLREPGIGGTCRECGEIHASDAHYCSRCGEPLDDRARARRDAAIAAAAKPAPAPADEAPPASVLWAGATKQPAPAEPEPDQPAEITSEWLGTGAGQPTTFDRAVQPGESTPEEPPVNPWVATSERASASAEAAATPPAEASEPTSTDEPETTPLEPAASEPAEDEPVATPKPKRKPRTPKPAPETAFEPNGRRDEDVPAPEPDPLFPPREQS